MALLQKAEQGSLEMSEAERLATEVLSRKEDAGKEALRLSKEVSSQENMVLQLQRNVDKLRTTVQRYENDLVTLQSNELIFTNDFSAVRIPVYVSSATSVTYLKNGELI